MSLLQQDETIETGSINLSQEKTSLFEEFSPGRRITGASLFRKDLLGDFSRIFQGGRLTSESFKIEGAIEFADERETQSLNAAGEPLSTRREFTTGLKQFRFDFSRVKAGQQEDQGEIGGEPAFNEVALADVANPKALNQAEIQPAGDLLERLGNNGDVLDGGGGNNTVIGAGGSDVIFGDTPGAFNTITTGTGQDLIVLGSETTNRIFDFDPANDQFGIVDGSGLTIEDLIIGQGANPQNGGLDQPLDSRNNALVVNKATEQILASLTFVDSADISEKNFVTINPADADAVKEVPAPLNVLFQEAAVPSSSEVSTDDLSVLFEQPELSILA